MIQSDQHAILQQFCSSLIFTLLFRRALTFHSDVAWFRGQHLIEKNKFHVEGNIL